MSVVRNYKKEAAYEDRPDQVKRREARNKARKKAVKRYGRTLLHGKEVDHLGYHPTGSLANVPTKVVPKSVNRRRQPPHKGYK